MKYVIRWGNEWSYQTVPAHTVALQPGEPVYESKALALNAVITEMHAAKSMLHVAIKRAANQQKRMDRRPR